MFFRGNFQCEGEIEDKPASPRNFERRNDAPAFLDHVKALKEARHILSPRSLAPSLAKVVMNCCRLGHRNQEGLHRHVCNAMMTVSWRRSFWVHCETCITAVHKGKSWINLQPSKDRADRGWDLIENFDFFWKKLVNWRLGR